MALTVTPAAGLAGVPHAPGDIKRCFAKVTFDASYPTGGYAFTPATFGFTLGIVGVDPNPSSGAHFVVWDDVNSKLKVFTAKGTEVANATNLSTFTCNVEVAGY